MQPNQRGFDYRHVLLVLLLAWLVRCWFVWSMPPEARSCDSVAWLSTALRLEAGENPYKTIEYVLVWPPFWMQMIYLMYRISTALDVSFYHVLQICLAVFESLVVVAVFRTVRQIAPQARPVIPILLGIALNPMAILLICQHGNFDVIVGLWVLLFAGQLAQYHNLGKEVNWLAACLFLGLGILTKTVPLVLCPMLAGGWRRLSWNARLIGAAFVLGPVTLGMSIIYVLAPADVTTKVLAYRSSNGWFGISGLLSLAGVDGLIRTTNLLFYLLLAGAGAWVARTFWKREQVAPREIVLCAALFLAMIPALGPGYGSQYLYWYLPLLVTSYVLYSGTWRRVLVMFGFVAAVTYIVEYGVIPSHGRFIFHLMQHSHMFGLSAKQVEVMYDRVDWWTSAAGQTLMRLPLFLGFLVLLVTGVRLLVRNLRTGPLAMEGIPAGSR